MELIFQNKSNIRQVNTRFGRHDQKKKEICRHRHFAHFLYDQRIFCYSNQMKRTTQNVQGNVLFIDLDSLKKKFAQMQTKTDIDQCRIETLNHCTRLFQV